MADEIDFENGRISNFQVSTARDLDLDRAIWHTVVDHSSTSTYTTLPTPQKISFESEKLFVDGRTYRTSLLGRRSSRPNNLVKIVNAWWGVCVTRMLQVSSDVVEERC